MMNEDRNDDMKHEDNSFATKFGVIFSIVLISIVGVGCLFVLWQVIKIVFIFFN